MSNPNIERIYLEQVQEFRELDLYELAPPEAGKLILLAYDVPSSLFKTLEYDASGGSNGSIIIDGSSKLERDIIVATDDLPNSRGFIFKKGLNLTEVLSLLCNPIVEGVLTTSAVPSIIEINTATTVVISYNYSQNGSGAPKTGVPSNPIYKRDGTVVQASETTVISVEKTLVYETSLLVEANATFPEEWKTATDTVKVVYPNFSDGNGASNGTPPALTHKEVTDARGKKYILVPFQTYNGAIGSGAQYYWFAVHQSFTPKDYAGVIDGQENPLNSGPIDALFNKQGTMVYAGNTYDIWMTNETIRFEELIKIKF